MIIFRGLRGVLWCALTVMLVQIVACAPEPKNLSPEEKEGYGLYKVYCSQCHRLQSPRLHSPEKWPETLDKMKRIMQEKSEKVRVMSDEEKAKILLFLQSQAR